MEKNVLVTGGAGFIGSHTCKALSQAGYLPITLDNLERGHQSAVKWGPFERADLRNPDEINRVMAQWRPVAVVHFAAYAYVGESVTYPLMYYKNNIGGTANLLGACVESACRNIVFSSSCATYGVPCKLPLTEDDPQQPINPYGYSKLVVERMLKDVNVAHGINHVALRYFNAAGADPDGEIGEMHEPEPHLIPLVLQAALKKRAIEIFGNDYPTPDGTCIRDYVHVCDLAEAHVAAIDWLLAGQGSASFNLGNGEGFSVAEVINVAERVTKTIINAEITERRPGDPPILISDSSKARRMLRWAPKYPDIEQQIIHAWRWFNDEAKFGDSSVNGRASSDD